MVNLKTNMTDTETIDGNKAWVQERYYTISEDQTVYTVNLAKMVADFGYAHLNGIKEVSLKEVIKAQQFNLAGQKVGDNAKGLVIKNGKKYIK